MVEIEPSNTFCRDGANHSGKRSVTNVEQFEFLRIPSSIENESMTLVTTWFWPEIIFNRITPKRPGHTLPFWIEGYILGLVMTTI